MNQIKTAVVIGGTGGLGRAVAEALAGSGARVVAYGRNLPEAAPEGIEFARLNLLCDDTDALDPCVDAVFYAAGLGRVAPFEALGEMELTAAFRTNAEGFARVLKHYMPRLLGDAPFYLGVVSSIAGYVASPLFAAYGASKAAVRSLCESVNAELQARGSANRVLDVAPGMIEGTGFYGGADEPEKTRALAAEIVRRLLARETRYIPGYEEVYRDVLARYRADPEAFAAQSARYKLESGRMSDRPRGKVGFLSGTFDLFHIGHLNLLRRAKQYCDYLIVGIHPPGASHKNKPTFIPLEERMEIVGSVKYVDKVVVTLDEDDEMYPLYRYDYLFVGSDYQGTPRFMRYERELEPLGVKIIYFPYTQGTSSTQLREALSRKCATREDET